MQHLVGVDVVQEGLVVVQVWMQLDQDRPWVEAQAPRPDEVDLARKKTRQAEVHLVPDRPLELDSVDHPREEDTRRRGRGGTKHRLGEREGHNRLFTAHGGGCAVALMKAAMDHGTLMPRSRVGGTRKHPFGRVDQLEDRYLGMVEAPSSNLGTSTKHGSHQFWRTCATASFAALR